MRKDVAFDYVKTKDMIADNLTKPVPERKLIVSCNGMGVYP